MTTSGKHLREYLWYSFGEIILVVIGILIAIQVNNWNEDRIEQKHIYAYARALASDLRDDIAAVTVSAYQARNVVFQIDNLVAYVQDRSFDEINNIELYPYVWSLGYRPFAFNRTSLGPMKSSGALHEMQDHELARRISEYEALTYHLEEDQASDSRNARDAYLASNKVINRNFRGRADVDKYFEGASTEETFQKAIPEFWSTDLYRQVKQSEVGLVATDLRGVQEMTNVLISYRGDLYARPDLELPRLIFLAQELIDFIDTEFPEE
jgi:hypothetical protein